MADLAAATKRASSGRGGSSGESGGARGGDEEADAEKVFERMARRGRERWWSWSRRRERQESGARRMPGMASRGGDQRCGRGRRQLWQPAAAGGICGVRADGRGGAAAERQPPGTGRVPLGSWVSRGRGGMLWAECAFGLWIGLAPAIPSLCVFLFFFISPHIYIICF